MKTLSISLIAVAAACGLASAQTAYTTPVGYTTSETILASNFSLLGLTVHQPTIAAGVLEAVTSTSVTDSDINFTTILTSGNTYIIEISDDASSANGGIAETISWAGSQLNTPSNLTLLGAAPGVKYKLRKASTISDIFGANNEAGLKAGTSTTADVIWVPTGTGTFDQYFRQPANPPFVPSPFWAKIGTAGNFGNAPIVYLDGIIIQRRDTTNLNIVVTGEVKKNPTIYSLSGSGAFNYLGSSFPVGSTLDNSGLSTSLLSGTSTTADIVWMPNGTGGYNQYFYQPANPPFVPSPQWVRIGVAGNAGSTPLTSGILIQRRGINTNAKISPPPFYSNL
jgi:hypothetical protein